MKVILHKTFTLNILKFLTFFNSLIFETNETTLRHKHLYIICNAFYNDTENLNDKLCD